MRRCKFKCLLPLLAAFVGLTIFFALRSDKSLVLSAEIDFNGYELSVSPWYDSKTQSYLFVFPSFTSKENLFLFYESPYYSNDILIDSEWIVDNLGTVDEEKIVVDSKGNEFSVRFCKAENVGCLCVSTINGIDEVLKNKQHKETIKMLSVNDNGMVNYAGTDFTIKGHGNTTWHMDKRPFKVSSKEAINLDGNGDYSEWILLANALDSGEMRNHIVFETARLMGYESVPSDSFVDLYIDGEYWGLYQLTPSPESVFEEKLKEESAALFSAQLEERVSLRKEYVKTISGNYVEYSSSNRISKKQLDLAKENLLKADKGIMNEPEPDGKGLSELIDIRAWAERYLLDEAFENYDAGAASMYMYTLVGEEDSSMVYPGPIWDFDLSMGNLESQHGTTDDPKILYVANGCKSDFQNMLWYKQLYENGAFREEVVSEYVNVMRPILLYMEEEFIDEVKEEIGTSLMISAFRNHQEVDLNNYTSYLSDYLEKRINFLDDIWTTNKSFCSVIIEGMNNEIDIYYLSAGESLGDNAFFVSRSKGERLTEKGTGVIIDSSVPIYEDKILLCSYKEERGLKQSIYDKYYYNREAIPGLIGLFVLGCLFVVFFFKDHGDYISGKSRGK